MGNTQDKNLFHPFSKPGLSSVILTCAVAARLCDFVRCHALLSHT